MCLSRKHLHMYMDQCSSLQLLKVILGSTTGLSLWPKVSQGLQRRLLVKASSPSTPVLRLTAIDGLSSNFTSLTPKACTTQPYGQGLDKQLTNQKNRSSLTFPKVTNYSCDRWHPDLLTNVVAMGILHTTDHAQMGNNIVANKIWNASWGTAPQKDTSA